MLRPNPTFWQMRDYAVWAPALIVTFVYGLLAVFGLDQAREDVLHTTLSQAVPYVLITGVAVVFAGLILGAVTHTLARQFGGDGSWQPTVGLAMLIMSLTDAPRLLFALFLGGTATVVQAVGWVTWVAAGFLFTSMVSRSHDLPWPKALGASAIQLLGPAVPDQAGHAVDGPDPRVPGAGRSAHTGNRAHAASRTQGGGAPTRDAPPHMMPRHRGATPPPEATAHRLTGSAAQRLSG